MKLSKIVAGVTTYSVLTASALTSLASAGDIEANVALSTDYVFRGFSQTQEEPAISGGLDYGFDNGFYVGTWASNVNFDTNTSTEIDLYAGYAFEVSDGVELDFSYFYFVYPGDENDFNYSEFAAAVNLGDLGLSVVYSPDYFGSDATAFVLNADYSWGFSENWSLDLHAGFSDVDEADFFTPGTDSYVDYSVGISTSAKGVDLSLTLYGTDIDNIEAADDRLVFSVGKSF